MTMMMTMMMMMNNIDVLPDADDDAADHVTASLEVGELYVARTNSFLKKKNIISFFSITKKCFIDIPINSRLLLLKVKLYQSYDKCSHTVIAKFLYNDQILLLNKNEVKFFLREENKDIEEKENEQQQ